MKNRHILMGGGVRGTYTPCNVHSAVMVMVNDPTHAGVSLRNSFFAGVFFSLFHSIALFEVDAKEIEANFQFLAAAALSCLGVLNL